MLTPDKTKIYITKNLTDEQFEILLDYLIKEDGNWEADEIENFRKDKVDSQDLNTLQTKVGKLWNMESLNLKFKMKVGH